MKRLFTLFVVTASVGVVLTGTGLRATPTVLQSSTTVGQPSNRSVSANLSQAFVAAKEQGDLLSVVANRSTDPAVPEERDHRRALDQGGETIEEATMIHFLPYIDNGQTFDAIDNYDELCPTPSPSPDVVYSFFAAQPTVVDISLCNGTGFDTKLYVYENVHTPGNPYACNDNACPGLTSEILGLLLNPGFTYYIVVDGSSGQMGSYVIQMSGTTQGCDVQPPPESFPEGEPICFDDYDDFYNSGCNTPDQIFQSISCGQTVFATSGTFLYQGQNARDTDWYQVFLVEPMQVTWEVNAEFEVQLLILRSPTGSCSDYSIIGAAQTPACQPGSVTIGQVDPGPLWLWAGPVGFTGVPCGAEYTGTVVCSPVAPAPPNDNCDSAIPLSGEVTVNYSNVGATTDGPDEPALCTSGGDTQVGSDIWYSYIPDCDANLTVSLCGSSYDTKLAIYQPADGLCPTQPSAISCNDDFCGLSSQITLPVIGGGYYLFRVGGWNGGQGNGILAVTRDQPCPTLPCVSVGYIQISPSDGLLNHYGRVNTVRVELTNLEPADVTVPLTISDCEQSIDYDVTLLAGECRLVALPFAWTPNEECQPNFISVSVPWEPPCAGNSMYTKPLPIPAVAYQTLSRHDGIPSPNVYFPPGGDIVLVRFEPSGTPCRATYFGYWMSAQSPDSLKDPVDAVVYDDNGPGGTPGNMLAYMPSLTTRTLENNYIYAVPQQPVEIESGGVYVGFRGASHCAPSGVEAVKADLAYDNPGTTYLQSGTDWIPINPPGDLMIDVYTQCPCPTQGSNPVFGYNYITSDDPLGPEFNWVDITTVGTTWSDSCPSCHPIEPPWDPTTPGDPTGPPTYDQDWVTHTKISLNGFISFQLEGLGSGHMLMPNPELPNSVVAPLWTECETCINYIGEVYWYGDPNTGDLIVQWDSVLARESDYLTFEAIIHSNGDILFQYRNAPSYLDYTVGLESADGTQALVVYQEGGCPPIHDNFAILFTNENAPPGISQLTVYRGPNLSNNTILRWESLAPGLYYNVYAGTSSDFVPPGQGTYLGTTTGTSFTDAGVVSAQLKRFYRVIASNQPLEGGNSNAER